MFGRRFLRWMAIVPVRKSDAKSLQNFCKINAENLYKKYIVFVSSIQKIWSRVIFTKYMRCFLCMKIRICIIFAYNFLNHKAGKF